MSFLSREADHVEGFAPELAIVTHGGGEELEEKLVVRPTSETIMYEMYSKWIQSHRDLPLSLNQWNNVVRWEKRTYFFLRTTEFLWQEAHTAHATHEEEFRMVLDGLEAYRTLVEDTLAIPVFKGRKSEDEKFAGADVTTTIEAMIPDGKALQAGTSHDLGQNFSKKEAFNIAFQNAEGKTDYVWQTSYGLSTRIIGALIMTHGDDDGLVLPPKIAPVQVMVISANPDQEVHDEAARLAKEFQQVGIRAQVDKDAEHGLGWKLNEAEIQGIPVTIVVGKKEMESGTLTASIRSTKEKRSLPRENVANTIASMLSEIQQQMFDVAKKRRDSQVSEVTTFDEFKEVMETKRGFLKAFWCEESACEKEIKEVTKASTRCLPFIDENGNVAEEQGVCVHCGKPATHRWLFAQSY
jgi:prolyl-tRNA synthetase